MAGSGNEIWEVGVWVRGTFAMSKIVFVVVKKEKTVFGFWHVVKK